MSTSSYKGYGLGLMVDILCGVISGQGAALGNERARQGEMGQWFAAWRIDLFRDPEEFQTEMRDWLDAVRASRPAPGVDEVRVAGDPEHQARDEREAHGIPIDVESVTQLCELGDRVGGGVPGRPRVRPRPSVAEAVSAD